MTAVQHLAAGVVERAAARSKRRGVGGLSWGFFRVTPSPPVSWKRYIVYWKRYIVYWKRYIVYWKRYIVYWKRFVVLALSRLAFVFCLFFLVSRARSLCPAHVCVVLSISPCSIYIGYWNSYALVFVLSTSPPPPQAHRSCALH